MAVYRVNKNRGYTVMANFHLRDKSLSLKAVGLLSKMLSFNDGWKFSTKGLSAICKEGPDAILSALRELETHGYLVRHRQRDGKGRMSSTIFEIYEEPQESTPEREMPHTENPCVEKPDVDNPHGDKSAQINTDQVITQERNTLSKNYQSIMPFSAIHFKALLIFPQRFSLSFSADMEASFPDSISFSSSESTDSGSSCIL